MRRLLSGSEHSTSVKPRDTARLNGADCERVGSRNSDETSLWFADLASAHRPVRRGPTLHSISTAARCFPTSGQARARIFELACQQLGVSPTESVFLDDMQTNVDAAAALGMTPVLVADSQLRC